MTGDREELGGRREGRRFEGRSPEGKAGRGLLLPGGEKMLEGFEQSCDVISQDVLSCLLKGDISMPLRSL